MKNSQTSHTHDSCHLLTPTHFEAICLALNSILESLPTLSTLNTQKNASRAGKSEMSLELGIIGGYVGTLKNIRGKKIYNKQREQGGGLARKGAAVNVSKQSAMRATLAKKEKEGQTEK